MSDTGNSSGWYARDILHVILISAGFFLLGYMLAYLLRIENLLYQLIPGWTSSDTEFAAEIRLLFVQMLVGSPCAYCHCIPVFSIILFLVTRFKRPDPLFLRISSAMVSFIFGFVIYSPFQLLLLLAYAF